MKRETLQSILRYLLTHLTDLEFRGLEHIPSEGGVIIATNHISRIDIPVLFVTPNRDDITALVTTKYQNYPFFRWIINTAGGIWLDRTKADFTAFRAAYEALKEGRAVGISPEGTRSESGVLLPGKGGTALIAAKMGVPIVPVGLIGTAEAIPEILKFKKPRVIANYGPAFTLPPIPRENRDETVQAYTEEIMLRIAALLPEKQRGHYAGHPGLVKYTQENVAVG
jgi:1-acyl-sn-glycerol-3-phosphate acyltransferase